MELEEKDGRIMNPAKSQKCGQETGSRQSGVTTAKGNAQGRERNMYFLQRQTKSVKFCKCFGLNGTKLLLIIPILHIEPDELLDGRPDILDWPRVADNGNQPGFKA